MIKPTQRQIEFVYKILIKFVIVIKTNAIINMYLSWDESNCRENDHLFRLRPRTSTSILL